jgi:hypothetical protein
VCVCVRVCVCVCVRRGVRGCRCASCFGLAPHASDTQPIIGICFSHTLHTHTHTSTHKHTYIHTQARALNTELRPFLRHEADSSHVPQTQSFDQKRVMLASNRTQAKIQPNTSLTVNETSYIEHLGLHFKQARCTTHSK